MAYTLKLKWRPGRESISIPLQNLREMLKSQPEQVLEELGRLAANDQVHDKFWLEMIVNWAPEGGIPLTEMSKWLKLAQRVGSLDDSREGDFTLSQWTVDLIWARLTHPKFLMVRMSPALAGFLVEFQEATGKRFQDQEPEPEE
ncbi:MAG TPA: hypothetical protein VI729_04485 [Anaerolineales bacterium]|nr:hypothetical protein [Anaerolineales bacterium]